MNREKVVLSILAVVIGLIVAIAGFYIYQATKQIDTSKIKPISIIATPTPAPSVFLKVNEPTDEEVSDKKIVNVSGTVQSDAIIIVLTEDGEEVLNPTLTGDFLTTITLNDGENLIRITAIAPNGETSTIEKTVTYSTENF